MAKTETLHDIEEAMNKELLKKKKNGTKVFEVARAEFIEWYQANVSTGVIPWSEPAISWLFAGWVAGEMPREWPVTEEKAGKSTAGTAA